MRSDEVQQASTSPTAMIDLWAAQERDIQQLQHEWKDLQPILDWLEHGILPQTDKEARQLILRSEHFQIIDGVLYHLHFPRTKRLNVIKPILHQLCVPDVLREELLIAYHDNNAHIRRERLYDTLKQKYYFPLLSNMLQHVIIVNERNHPLIYVRPHLLHYLLLSRSAEYILIMSVLYPRRRKDFVIC